MIIAGSLTNRGDYFTIPPMESMEEYITVSEAVKLPDINYTPYWIRRLAQDGKIKGRKIGGGRRAVWLIHLPSLRQYIKEVEEAKE